MPIPHSINVTRHASRASHVYLWDCTCGSIAMKIYLSSSTAELDAHRHLHATHRLNPTPEPVHTRTTAEDGVGGWEWTCSCGAGSNAAASHRQERRARQAGTLHFQRCVLAFYRATAISERAVYDFQVKQTEAEQLRLSQLSPEGRARLIQRNLESIL